MFSYENETVVVSNKIAIKILFIGVYILFFISIINLCANASALFCESLSV